MAASRLSRCWAAVWAMFRRNTSTPSWISSASRSTPSHAGPIVATIFVLVNHREIAVGAVDMGHPFGWLRGGVSRYLRYAITIPMTTHSSQRGWPDHTPSSEEKDLNGSCNPPLISVDFCLHCSQMLDVGREFGTLRALSGSFVKASGCITGSRGERRYRPVLLPQALSVLPCVAQTQSQPGAINSILELAPWALCFSWFS